MKTFSNNYSSGAIPPQPASLDENEARRLDAQDPLAHFREEFVITNPELIYLDGNSLGRLPRRTVESLNRAVAQQWGDRLIRSWGEGWLEAPTRVGDKIAQLLGAAPGEVIVSDSTTVNLYKLVMAALSLRPERTKIITDTLNFPSDVYILQGCAQSLGGRYRLALVDMDEGDDHAAGSGWPDYTRRILDALDEHTGLVVLSHVVFKSGYLYDAAAITRRAHELGALVLWDLSHSAGAVPIQLDAWGADFAVGCTYKYLNGGPGAPAFLYVNSALQDQVVSPIWGWFGEDKPFAFDLDYHPAKGAARFLCGTPPILAMQGIESGVDLLLEAGLPALREKSVAQTAYLIRLYDHYLAPLGFSLGTPREAERRGSHISLIHAQGYRINRALIEEMQVIPDFREPDVIRLGIAPLYTRYIDLWQAAARIARVVKEKRYEKYPSARLAVT